MRKGRISVDGKVAVWGDPKVCSKDSSGAEMMAALWENDLVYALVQNLAGRKVCEKVVQLVHSRVCAEVAVWVALMAE